MFTNGILINERIANYLTEFPPFSIEITLYGATRETYEAVTQVRGSFDRCMRAIDLLLERKLPLKLKTVPTSINQHEVYEMKSFAAATQMLGGGPSDDPEERREPAEFSR